MALDTTPATSPVLRLPAKGAALLTAAGALVTIISTFLAWTWTSEFPGDLTYYGSPAGLQLIALAGGVLTLLYAAAALGVRGTGWLAPASAENAVLYLAMGTFGAVWYTLIAIAVDTGGLVNLEPGGFVAGVGALAALAGALGLPVDRRETDPWDWAAAGKLGGGAFLVGVMLMPEDWATFTTMDLVQSVAIGAGAVAVRALLHWLRLGHVTRPVAAVEGAPAWREILAIVVAFGIGLYVFTYGIDTETAEDFVGFLILVAFAFVGLNRAGLIGRLKTLTLKHRNVTFTAAFVAAAAFPVTQENDAYTSVATNILIFATVALGLNVVVGLAGLLDLGYVAFLGVGAYTAALVSGSAASSIGVRFPFWAAMLTGAAVSLVFGVVIGAPTLRLRGDYLAIVTLGFGEIFRLVMQNLNGTSGPNVTNGSAGISNIPELELFGWNFGESHDLGFATINRFGSYFLLMLFVTLIVVLVFRRSSESRIGRAWVAIREDETAATAMGINTFRLKLLAFALGASLAGLAGTVQAHVTTTVTPEQYLFANTVPPNSAFLLAAVILGGMGTVSGPIIGASLLFLIPAKLTFLNDWQLLLFGLALVLLMRFRPEGLVADRRKQLEFHDTGQLDVPKDAAILTKVEA
ncbi:branched-chain amino acid ABC transporter permease [Streptomyces sp. NPDC051940]|uniref:branched-chain amino acid ABC transporter permease n=1 Tax=Streptomyces sp. NPDC051940 TaxID=3155675 RepID=UPI003412708B